jgi:hypothetical protein
MRESGIYSGDGLAKMPGGPWVEQSDMRQMRPVSGPMLLLPCYGPS